jgi:acetyl esterase
MIGRTYLEHGRPVVVLLRGSWRTGAPRNVLIRREDGTCVVRPFRGLRLPPEAPEG